MAEESGKPRFVEGDFRKFVSSRMAGDGSTASTFGRYERLEFIGEGGMARVYKAYDPTLGRQVALKFLRMENRDLSARLLSEARAQARIQHEHVCRVYEVGEIEGRSYIAMEYIDGKKLQALIGEMILEQKVNVMRQVADAVHAAHRAGLIHRDLKTANIIVERTEDGEWFPYVMDFGLAREIGIPGLTQTGTVVGSPLYMSPEQARGGVTKLDRRSDVYSLGVTLYELLTGKLPLEGDTGVDVLLKLFREEVVPVAARDASIPLDLQTIVMKCLENDPARRYQSAELLSEDLQRFLEGDPIQARRSSLTYRAWKKARKHKPLVSISLVALVLLLILSSIAAHVRNTAAKQAALAQQFGNEAEKIEGFMRIAYLLPLHDVTQEENLVREKISKLEQEMDRQGEIGYGPGQYALGRGFASLHEYEKAREHLEKAWNAGYHQPETACALGQVMGELYRIKMDEAGRMGDPELRRMTRKQVEQTYLSPALRYLTRGKGASLESPLYTESLIAFYEKRYEVASEKAHRAFAENPWLYEARKLEGDLYVLSGEEKQNAGNSAGAASDYTLAGQMYADAMKIGRSDASIYQAECTRRVRVMAVQISRGDDPLQGLDEVLQPCGSALTAGADAPGIFAIRSLAYLIRRHKG